MWIKDKFYNQTKTSKFFSSLDFNNSIYHIKHVDTRGRQVSYCTLVHDGNHWWLIWKVSKHELDGKAYTAQAIAYRFSIAYRPSCFDETFPFGILFHLIHQEFDGLEWISRTFSVLSALFQIHFHSWKSNSKGVVMIFLQLTKNFCSQSLSLFRSFWIFEFCFIIFKIVPIVAIFINLAQIVRQLKRII